jgi:hypothetical protein
MTGIRVATSDNAQEVLRKMARHTGIMAIALVICAAGACERKDRERVDISPARPAEPNEPATKAPEGVPTRLSNDTVISRIVEARCARELRCENIGKDKKFESVAICRSELTKKGDDMLDAKECPRGIDSKELGECLAEVKNEDCNNPLDTLERLAACRASDLCLNVP